MNSFQPSSKIFIETEVFPSPEPKGILVFFPCMRGNFRRYKLPRNILLNAGYHFACLNPRGHGHSEGLFEFDTALKDAVEYIQWLSDTYPGLQIHGLGHSGGGTVMAMLANKMDVLEQAYLCSPILDTRASLFSLYEENRIEEFISAVKDWNGENAILEEYLPNRKWLDMDFWASENLRERFNEYYKNLPSPQDKIGDFLENLFLPGLDIRDVFSQKPEKFHFFLPAEDVWFPKSITEDIALKNGISCSLIPSAKDHFFRDGWKSVVECIVESLEERL
ncbi:MAG: alpha/beta fold hydrolase [Leptospira sp.]|nr:alpha/beta fold hydrolase [Leptospira sp.]